MGIAPESHDRFPNEFGLPNGFGSPVGAISGFRSQFLLGQRDESRRIPTDKPSTFNYILSRDG